MPDTHRDIVAYMNHICGTQFRPDTKSTLALITARLNEGYSVDDFKTVIDKKVQEWANQPNMAQYLRPQTLFGPKFESYLNQPWANAGRTSQTDLALMQYIRDERIDVIDVAEGGDMYDTY